MTWSKSVGGIEGWDSAHLYGIVHRAFEGHWVWGIGLNDDALARIAPTGSVLSDIGGTAKKRSEARIMVEWWGNIIASQPEVVRVAKETHAPSQRKKKST